MSSGGSCRERSRADFLNTDFEQTFGRLLDRGWPQVGRKLAQNWPNLLRSCPQGGQDAPSWPKIALRWPKVAQDGPKMAPRWLQVAPSCPKFALSCPHVGPKLASSRPKWPQVRPSWPKLAANIHPEAKLSQRRPNLGATWPPETLKIVLPLQREHGFAKIRCWRPGGPQ